jgi:hypothetical protein
MFSTTNNMVSYDSMRRIWGHATNIYIFTSNHRDGTRKLVRL